MIEKTKFLFILLISIFMINSLDSYAGGGGKQRKDDRKIGGGSSPGCKVIEKKTKIIIYDSNFSVPTIRSYSWPNVPLPYPSPWGGAASASSIYDSMSTKYYCLVTVLVDCPSWGEHGVKSYVWNSKSNELDISVPENYTFRVNIEYYEPCGPYWTGGNTYGRGKWASETTTGYASVIPFSIFLFVKKEIC